MSYEKTELTSANSDLYSLQLKRAVSSVRV
jgi:hypothetical protein